MNSNNETRSGTTAPVLFIIFNRPSTTNRVFEAIRQARPKQLFVAADGPRKGKDGEEEKCMEARSIINAVDWDCEVKTLFRTENLGCGRGPADAITWFFNQVNEGIVLEDDCLPSSDFFPYCTELLERYRNDLRVMDIGGVNLLPESFHSDEEYSYYFSKHCNTWGWGTWRRAWRLFDYEIKSYASALKNRVLQHSFDTAYEREYFAPIFEKTYHHNADITWWDYQWEFLLRVNSGLTVWPNRNLILNIGLGDAATHTMDQGGIRSRLKHEPLAFPLKHPEHIVADFERDTLFFRENMTTFRSRIKSRIKRALPAPVQALLARK